MFIVLYIGCVTLAGSARLSEMRDLEALGSPLTHRRTHRSHAMRPPQQAAAPGTMSMSARGDTAILDLPGVYS